MTKKRIHKVFASINSYERCITLSRQLAEKKAFGDDEIEQSLLKQEEIIAQMRRAANKLQFEFAQKDWQSVRRSLDIIYGLGNMVRPEVSAMFKRLAYEGANPLAQEGAKERPKDVILH